MAGKLSNAELEGLVQELVQVRQKASGREARELLVRALGSGSPHVQTKAAEVIAEQRLDGYEEVLLSAFGKAMAGGVKADPGCRLKLFAVEALDFMDCMEAEPFLQATNPVSRARRGLFGWRRSTWRGRSS